MIRRSFCSSVLASLGLFLYPRKEKNEKMGISHEELIDHIIKEPQIAHFQRFSKGSWAAIFSRQHGQGLGELFEMQYYRNGTILWHSAPTRLGCDSTKSVDFSDPSLRTVEIVYYDRGARYFVKDNNMWFKVKLSDQTQIWQYV